MPDPAAPPVAADHLDEVRRFAYQVMERLEGFLVSGTIYLGRRLGLYDALAGRGPTGAEGLAEATGLHPRWVREWLRAQGAAGLLEHRGDERFELTPAGAEVLADDDSLFFAAQFSHLPWRAAMWDPLTECFRTGIGLSFDDRGPEGAEMVEGLFGNWYRQMLVPVVLAGLDGVTAKLVAGAAVADVGCGAGVALVEMGKAYPASDLHGYEISRYALERAEKNRAAAGVANVEFHDVAEEPLPDDHRFDLVMTLDCVHDMTRPEDAVAALRGAVDDDGTWLWAEPRAFPTYEENVEQIPLPALSYAVSLMGCMSSAMSEPGGAGLGTLGMPEARAREMASAAGFTRFSVHDFANPINLYFEVRP